MAKDDDYYEAVEQGETQVAESEPIKKGESSPPAASKQQIRGSFVLGFLVGFSFRGLILALVCALVAVVIAKSPTKPGLIMRFLGWRVSHTIAHVCESIKNYMMATDDDDDDDDDSNDDGSNDGNDDGEDENQGKEETVSGKDIAVVVE